MAAADDQARIADLFAAFGPVTVRRMFGGAGLYADGLMFGILDGDAIYLKADGALAADFAREGAAQFTYMREGRSMAMSYWRLPERLYDDPDELAAWARRAVDCAIAAKAEKPSRKKRAVKPRR